MHNAAGILLRLLRLRGGESARRHQKLLLRHERHLVPASAVDPDDFDKLGEETQVPNAGFAVRVHLNMFGPRHNILLHAARLAGHFHGGRLLFVASIAAVLRNRDLCV